MAKHDQEGNVLEVQKTRLKPPPLYKVILLNDDYTPMDFVVVVLQTVFAMSREKATQVMLQVHREGMGVCGTYTREVAAAKVDQVLGHRAKASASVTVHDGGDLSVNTSTGLSERRGESDEVGKEL